MSDVEVDGAIVINQVGILHGGYIPCSNKEYPAIYVRLDSPRIFAWLQSQIDIPGFWSGGSEKTGKGSSTYYVITFEGGGGHKMMMVDDVREGGLSK